MTPTADPFKGFVDVPRNAALRIQNNVWVRALPGLPQRAAPKLSGQVLRHIAHPMPAKGPTRRSAGGVR